MPALADALAMAVTAYDRRESKKRHHNRYALGQYLMRVDEIAADVDAGATPRAALLAAFDGRLLDHCLRAIGEPVAADGERQSAALYYVPASER